MSYNDAFTVATQIGDLAVNVHDGAVTGIRLNAQGAREPRTPTERRIAHELEQYARGERRTFTFTVAVDGTDFERRVWDTVGTIPYGETRTYGEIARTLGRPGAARAVGRANGRNPIPIVIPCHRVVAAGGKLGGYGGGLDLKRRLLALEHSCSPLRLLSCLALLLLGMLGASACADPERPDFGSNSLLPDTTPPTIMFLEPAEADSVFDTGSQILVGVRILDRSPITSVAASVLGLITFGFETVFPNDTLFEVLYPISTPLGPSGRIELRVVATDSAQNRSTASRGFVLQ